MKLSKNFIFRTVAGEPLLIPVGEAALQVKGLIALSESGALLYEKLQQGCNRETLIAALTETYEVSRDEAARDTEGFLSHMQKLGILEE